ncbi:hypothetical protein BH24GEM3_BH24GEM3_14940 [soil metagenome]
MGSVEGLHSHQPLRRSDWTPLHLQAGKGLVDEAVDIRRVVQRADDRVANLLLYFCDAFRAGAVFDRIKSLYVEGRRGAFSADQYRHSFPQRVADTQLVEDIGVECAGIDDGNASLEDVGEHPLMDPARLVDVITAQALDAINKFHGFFDHKIVDLVEVDFLPVDILLHAVGHDDEADIVLAHRQTEEEAKRRHASSAARASGAVRQFQWSACPSSAAMTFRMY